MSEWIHQHGIMLTWLGLSSLVLFFIGMVVAPLWVIRLPADYFIRLRQERRPLAVRTPRHVLAAIGRNLLGGLLILAGICMLVLPGQGLLSIFMGILLIDCPRKHQLVKWITRQPVVLHSVNWLRRRAGRQPMILDKE